MGENHKELHRQLLGGISRDELIKRARTKLN